MTVKTFIWNHLLTIIAGSAILPTAIMLYQFIVEGENDFDGFGWIIPLFMLVAFVVSIPYFIVMLLISAYEKEEVKWRRQKFAQIVMSIAAILICLILSYAETTEVILTLVGLISLYGLIGTTLVYFPRKPLSLSGM